MCGVPGIFKGTQFDEDEKEERTVDIYVSGDSLTVYDNPWVEGIQPPNAPNTGRNQLPVPTVPVHPVKKNPFRAAAVFLGLLSLFLLAGLIALGVKSSKNENRWDTKRNSLEAANANLTNERDQLRLERDKLQNRLREVDCPDDWERLHCSCYFVSVGRKENWRRSKEACENINAHLVIISSREEQEFVKKVLTDKEVNAWIGLFHDDDEDVWKWVDEAPLTTERYWPDDSKSSLPREDCIVMGKSKDDVLNWKKERCNKPYSWICEKEIL